MIRCTFDGCGSPHHAAGLCDSHYAQRKKGRELTAIAHRPNVLQWVREHVQYAGDECLIWPFSRSKDGYAQMKGGRAHRRMCELAHGKPPTPKHEVAHNCGKGHEGCVNPRHLRWATHVENIGDMVKHGTRKVGVDLPWAKLTPDEVLRIRATHKRRSSPLPFLTKYNITRATFYDVVNRVTWRHI